MWLKVTIVLFVLFTNLSLTIARKCDENGYKHVEGIGWYKFHTQSKPWLEASKVCTKEGAHLAVINSEKEHQAIIDIFKKERFNIDDRANRWDMAWLGGHKVVGKNGSDKWMTIFGEPLSSSSYAKWSQHGCYGYPPEPNNYDGNENCLSVFVTCDQGLNDQICNHPLGFVCEKFDTCERTPNIREKIMGVINRVSHSK